MSSEDQAKPEADASDSKEKEQGTEANEDVNDSKQQQQQQQEDENSSNKAQEKEAKPKKEEEINLNVTSEVAISIDPLDALKQLCDQFASIVVPYSETEQALIESQLSTTSTAHNNNNNNNNDIIDESKESSKHETDNKTEDASLHNDNSGDTTETSKNIAKSTSPTPRLLSGIPVAGDQFKQGEKPMDNDIDDEDDNNSNMHPTFSLINNMNQLVLTLSNTLDETVIRLEELQSIGLNQLQPAIEECGKKADINETRLLEDRLDELEDCFDSIDTIEDMISTIDMNLSQHEWRFNQLRSLYVEELGLPPQPLNVMNDSIATTEEFELITQGATNFQKKVNSFGDWITKSVKDKTEQIVTKSKDIPKGLSHTATNVKQSFTNLFSHNKSVGTGTQGVGYDGYAEAKENQTKTIDENRETDDNNTTNIDNNNNNNKNDETNRNDNNNNDTGNDGNDDNDDTSPTWPLKPEETKSKHPFGAFGSLRNVNVNLTGAMAKMKENISKNVSNITKKKDATSPTSPADSTNENKNEENFDESGQKPTAAGPLSSQTPKLQTRPSIKDMFKIKDKKYANEIEGDDHFFNWKPEQLPNVENMLQKKKSRRSLRNVLDIPNESGHGNVSNAANNKSSLLGVPENRLKKDSIGSDTSAGSAGHLP